MVVMPSVLTASTRRVQVFVLKKGGGGEGGPNFNTFKLIGFLCSRRAVSDYPDQETHETNTVVSSQSHMTRKRSMESKQYEIQEKGNKSQWGKCEGDDGLCLLTFVHICNE